MKKCHLKRIYKNEKFKYLLLQNKIKWTNDLISEFYF